MIQSRSQWGVRRESTKSAHSPTPIKSFFLTLVVDFVHMIKFLSLFLQIKSSGAYAMWEYFIFSKLFQGFCSVRLIKFLNWMQTISFKSHPTNSGVVSPSRNSSHSTVFLASFNKLDSLNLEMKNSVMHNSVNLAGSLHFTIFIDLLIYFLNKINKWNKK